jgi:hypothetical protein
MSFAHGIFTDARLASVPSSELHCEHRIFVRLRPSGEPMERLFGSLFDWKRMDRNTDLRSAAMCCFFRRKVEQSQGGRVLGPSAFLYTSTCLHMLTMLTRELYCRDFCRFLPLHAPMHPST